MDLREYLDVLRRRWHFVVACVLLGLAAAAAVTVLMPRTYTAKAQLFIATTDQNSANAYTGSLFTQQRIKSYTRIANSPAVLGGVISRLGLDTTPEQLAGKVSAQAPLDTTLIDIRVKDRSPTRAQAIADETAVQFTQYIGSIEKASANAPAVVKASVVGNPGPPAHPTSPRPELNLAIGLVAGAVVGVTGAVIRHSSDGTIRSEADVRGRLGMIPVGALPKPRRRERNQDHRLGADQRDEALSRLRTRLRSPDGGMPRSVLVASAEHQEGRTATALDLAVNVARTDRRVVLVEGDLRRPGLARTLGLRNGPGLTDVVTGGAALHDALQNWPNGPIRILTAGTPASDPSTLLSARHMRQLLRALEADADLVVLDCPPLEPFADAAILASEAEAVLFVIRRGQSRYRLVQRALDSLAAVDAHIIGAVVTAVPADRRMGGHQPTRTRDDTAPAPVAPVAPVAPKSSQAPLPQADGFHASAGHHM
ncbi:Wzz/FepE/Etk N-terminal domain-containing protein [Streptomyces aquilus]|uniref:Wzz/FepE/Etk N-terminal domain-containing protein n=1 Tax=Streptomyces aquilus TaxID=2548456 RepID=UPI003686E026